MGAVSLWLKGGERALTIWTTQKHHCRTQSRTGEEEKRFRRFRWGLIVFSLYNSLSPLSVFRCQSCSTLARSISSFLRPPSALERVRGDRPFYSLLFYLQPAYSLLQPHRRTLSTPLPMPIPEALRDCRPVRPSGEEDEDVKDLVGGTEEVEFAGAETLGTAFSVAVWELGSARKEGGGKGRVGRRKGRTEERQ